MKNHKTKIYPYDSFSAIFEYAFFYLVLIVGVVLFVLGLVGIIILNIRKEDTTNSIATFAASIFAIVISLIFIIANRKYGITLTSEKVFLEKDMINHGKYSNRYPQEYREVYFDNIKDIKIFTMNRNYANNKPSIQDTYLSFVTLDDKLVNMFIGNYSFKRLVVLIDDILERIRYANPLIQIRSRDEILQDYYDKIKSEMNRDEVI